MTNDVIYCVISVALLFKFEFMKKLSIKFPMNRLCASCREMFFCCCFDKIYSCFSSIFVPINSSSLQIIDAIWETCQQTGKCAHAHTDSKEWHVYWRLKLMRVKRLSLWVNFEAKISSGCVFFPVYACACACLKREYKEKRERERKKDSIESEAG